MDAIVIATNSWFSERTAQGHTYPILVESALQQRLVEIVLWPVATLHGRLRDTINLAHAPGGGGGGGVAPQTRGGGFEKVY